MQLFLNPLKAFPLFHSRGAESREFIQGVMVSKGDVSGVIAMKATCFQIAYFMLLSPVCLANP